MESPLHLPSSLSSLKRFLRCLSSASAPPRASGGSVSFFSGGLAGESAAYRRSMLRRPETVKPWKVRWNSCSFMGTVVRPVQRFDESDPSSGAYTFLDVNRPSGDSGCSSFRITLDMQGKLAEAAFKHLKPNNFIYVSGRLGSYEKTNESGKPEIYYKIVVKDLNYVQCGDQNPTSQETENSGAEEMTVTVSSATDQQTASSSRSLKHEKNRERLHLWQVFFANPNEWWDNRQGKKNPRRPDFKHKDTGECLWLSPGDPPWVRKQLQLYDSKMATDHQRDIGGRRHEWKFKDLE